ncbi:MAG: PAS domain-containing sensor histidine kinase [Bradymonadales bacterium]|nr:PAS domain-containing sensor histidine kinase [Bradymonadales bacterium]
MPLRRKLLLFMVIPALLILMMGAIGFYSLLLLEQAAGRILADNYQSIQEARRMEHALRMLDLALTSPRLSGADRAGLDRLIAVFEESLRRCEQNITEHGETEVIDRIRSHWNILKPEPIDPGGDQDMGRNQPEHSASPRPVLEDRGRSAAWVGLDDRRQVEDLYEDLEELISLNERAMIESERETRRVARMMLGAVTGSALAALVALALFALVSARRISSPVTQVADRLHLALNPAEGGGVADGLRNLDEIQRLRQELDALLGRLARYEDEQNRKLSHLQGRLVFVMNRVLEGMVLMDTDHRILAANRVGRTILGMSAGEGQRMGDLDPSEEVNKLLQPLMEGTFQPERDLGEVRFEMDGSERIYRPRVVTVPASSGGVEGYLILFWDVTEQRRFEESRRRFISMLSHQLKTPMTALIMSVNLMRERMKEAPPGEAELLSIAAENCSNLSALVSDLIEAAREVTPDLTLNPRPLDLVRLLRSALRPLIPQAEEKGVTLTLPAEEGDILASVDPVKFPWVVTNMAGNALRYTGQGGHIGVVVRSEQGQVTVSVKDTGAGIAKENLQRVFEPYVSLDREPQPGTHGLGLAIAKEIVEAHGGTIEARSELGRGTEFVIRLPA